MLIIQKARGYKLHGKVVIQALPISIENERGSYRSGVDADGHEWNTFMYFAYGGIRGTEGVDGDNVDVYLGHAHYSTKVFIVHQNDPITDNYDEDKVMLFFNSAKEAKKAYMKQYDRPGFFGSMTEVDMQEFKKMLKERYGMKLKKALVISPTQLLKGQAGTRGVPDGSGANGEGCSGKGQGAGKPRQGKNQGSGNGTVQNMKKEGTYKEGDNVTFNVDAVNKGTKVEMEHTKDPAVAKQIALDHLAEFPDYYDKLADMEADMEKSVRLFVKAKGKKLNSGDTTERKDGTYIKMSGGKFKKLTVVEASKVKTRKGKGTGTRVKTLNKPSYNKNLFTPFMIGRLRKEFSGLKRIDPAGKTYSKMIKLLDNMDKVALNQIAESDIKFLSMLAKNRLLTKDRGYKLSKVKKSIVLSPINAKRVCDEI